VDAGALGELRIVADADAVRAVTTKISPTPAWVMKILDPFRT